jgi:AcrR family transcriptional regulator
MDAIAREAGVSKATLYAHFTGKEQLFAEMISGECGRLAEAIGDPLEAEEVRATLFHFGRRFAMLVYSSRGLAIYRIVVAEAPRFPEVGRIFYESGPRRVLERFEAYLREAARRGLLRITEPREAAAHFIGLIRGENHLRLLLGIDTQVSDAQVEHIVERSVETFLRAHRKNA